ncbi:DUF4241 domain-containing protein [uncultured Mucilaginibacter sp.]|uniref:DUF4241 domain-containing protein n=1 Tax=uncultured Mucilaginibacter sp. TaxID=797541 RepID=UPI0025E9C389|nr:DUF4241 domain-containing protein [uncultured Mucilaginibacter sp.]
MALFGNFLNSSKQQPEFPACVDYNIILENEIVEGKPVKMVDMGLLNVPTGSVVVCDPLTMPDWPPLNRKIPKGNYPVKIYLADFGNGHLRVTLAHLEIAPGRAERWALAVRDGEDVTPLKNEADYFGFPVDAGIGCFWDEKTRDAFVKLDKKLYETQGEGVYDLYLTDEFRKSATYPDDIGSWATYTIPGTQLNVTMFSSGWGDGRYPAYWGIDKDNKLVSLVIDFIILLGDEEDDKE